MSNVRTPFPSLVDASGVAAVLSKSLEGDAATGKVGSVGFSYKDSNGNLVLPMLTVAGAIPVDTGAGAGTPRSASAASPVGGSVGSDVDIAVITLVTGKVYSYIEANFACSNDALAKVIWNNNGSLVNLGYILSGPGQFTPPFSLKNLNFTAGSGTQELKLVAQNLYKASDLMGAISASQSM